jgi:NNP family nitrate/nitrite transporter-like MFS transporter
MLAVALAGYLLTAWAWALVDPLVPLLRGPLGLSPLQQALVVAVPVVVGTLGRIPAGALADRFGGRVVFLLVAAATLVALLELAVFGHRSVPGLMTGAVLVGVAGSTFAVAVPFVSAWFPAAHRGLALGVLGTGLCGGAIGGLTAVRLAEAHGMAAPYLVTAVPLVAFLAVAGFAARDAPRPARPVGPVVRRHLATVLRWRTTWHAAAWYSVLVALFVTFSNALPLYLANAYDLGPARAGDLMAAFVLLAVFMRPVGGRLADRLSPARPLGVALGVVTVATAVQAGTPPVPVVVFGTLPVLAVGLGIASTAVLVQIGATAPADTVGLVVGVVTAVAGVAGFVGQLLMAASFDRWANYGPALGVLALGAALATVSAVLHTRRSAILFSAESVGLAVRGIRSDHEEPARSSFEEET